MSWTYLAYSQIINDLKPYLMRLFSLVFCLSLLFSCTSEKVPESKALPNIVYILADDMGFGDVSALNEQSKLNTVNIDSMTNNGMVFLDAHTPSSVCTPTRYGILTGRYAWRTSLANGVTWSWSPPLIDKNRSTVASLLKKHAYHTACIGKWHLGLGWVKDSADVADITQKLTEGPLDNGFDYFFGITASLDIPPYIYIENTKSTTPNIDSIEARDGKAFWRKGQIGDDFEMEQVLPKLTEKAVNYINQQAKSSDPFFLYFPLPAPHTPILPSPEFQGKSGTNEYGDFVLMVDDVVGQIRKALSENGIAENTLLIFTSDNGCSPTADFEELEQFEHDPSFIYRGHKADIFEGGHRVPFIMEWPKVIAAGSKSEETTCLTDLMATTAAIIGDTLAANEGEDSFDFLPILKGNELKAPIREATVHHSVNGSFSIRQGDWKLSFCPGSGGWSDPRPKEAREQGLPPIQLHNLKEDPSEQNNLAASEPELVGRLTNLLEQYIQNGRSTPGMKQQNDRKINYILQ